MNRGLLTLALRETWPMTLMAGVTLLVVEAALAYVLPKFGMQFSQTWLQLRFMRGVMQAMLGMEVANHIGPDMFQAMAWVHPVVLALVWGHAVSFCTRLPAGEVDRGTIDILLSLPVGRWEVYMSESLVWMGSAAVVHLMGLMGNVIGSLGLPVTFRPLLGRELIVLLNLFCLTTAVGGFACLVSALSDRRGRSMTVVFVVLLGLFLLNYLAPFWKPLAHAVFLSPLHYHRPARILTEGSWPMRDLGVLLGCGGALWTAAGWLFARRDLCTV